jgi:hypothetical protein
LVRAGSDVEKTAVECNLPGFAGRADGKFAKAMVDMSQWLQSTGCRLNNPMLFDRSFDTI